MSSPQLKKLRENISRVIRTFSPLEQRAFYVLLALAAVGAIGVAFAINALFIEKVPAHGGSLTEGVIGTPRFVNPLLAISDTDRDLTALVYSGLMRATPGGALTEDLADDYTISDDRLIYTFTLKENLRWHDGEPVTADDVVFTIKKVQDSTLKSPKRATWEGITVEKIDGRTVQFTLERPYAPFLENTTLGILPEHLWSNFSNEQFGFAKFNVEPVGSGPYKLAGVEYDSSGIPKYYDFEPFKHFALGKPYLSNLRVKFYTNEEKLLRAFERGEAGAVNAISPQKARLFEERGYRIKQYVLPRVFGIFFNQNENNVFTYKPVRQALSDAINRDALIDNVLSGYGTALEGPLPPGALGYMPDKKEDNEAGEGRLEQAAELLDKAGFSRNELTGIRERSTRSGTEALSFSLATSDAAELQGVAEIVRERWAALGADVTLETYKTHELNQSIIRPREYEALLFGEIIGRESDPFAFWHSSQRNDPGLNIALYANITADDLLSRGRGTPDIQKRREIYQQFAEEVRSDAPAAFLYAPDFLYILPKKMKGVSVGTITVPSERFLDVHKWHVETERVWKPLKDL